jgi:hypothetical protein
MAYVAMARLLATALALAIHRARQDPVQGAGTKAMMADEQTTDNVGSKPRSLQAAATSKYSLRM